MMIGVAVIVGNQLFYIQVHLTGKLILWPYVEEKMLCDHSQEIKGCKYGGGGGGLVASIFAGYVPLASQSPYPISIYSMANY